jgi:hypothetical protein
MSAPNYGTAAQQAVLMLQKINKDVQLVENLEDTLDAQFSSIGPGEEIGLQQYRLPIQMEVGGVASAYQPDGGSYPQGTGPQYDQGILAPFPLMLAFTVTELAKRISKGGQDVVVKDYLARMIANAKTKAAHKRNQYLQGYNNGQLATIDATYAGGGSVTVPLKVLSFGGRRIDKGDLVEISDNAFNFRGTANILDIQKNSIGSPDVATLDAAPGGTVAGDFILMPGLSSGTPLFFNGLEYLVSPSTTGEYLGISRANSYVQSPAFNANGAFLTLGGTLAFLTRMQQALGTKRFQQERKKNVWYGHMAQWFSAQTLGFAKQMNVLEGGKASVYDGVPDPFAMKTLAGMTFMEDSTAAIDKLYFLDKSTLCRIRYPDSEKFLPGPLEGMFWPRVSGGLYTSQYDILYEDSVNYATKNNWANGVMYGLGVQAVFSN